MAASTVVVIGAGLAGLAAATTLSRCKKFSVVLLEASDQPGGRVKTCHMSDKASVPLGPMYFHGEVGNSLLEFATQTGVVKREDGLDGKATWCNFLSNGTKIPESVLNQHEQVFRDILSTASSVCDSVNSKEPDQASNGTSFVSMKDYVTAQFNQQAALHNLPPISDCSSQALLDCFLYIEGILEGSKSMEDVDLLRYNDFQWLEGVRYLLFAGNPMQNIVDELVKQLPEESLHLNCEVESIVWNQHQPHPITVHCTNGDQYSADHVITTVSLGVLKSKSNTPFFTPPLPKDKQEAIACLGYGTVNKVFVQFPELIFDMEYCSVRVFHKDGKLMKKFPWMRGLHRFHTVPGTDVLLFWFAGEDAIEIEQVPTSDLSDGICQVLETLLHRTIPAPIMVMSSQWHGNPLFCGSYSYSALGSKKQHRAILSTPVDGTTPLQLLFAGEATHTSLFSTANAAYDTGVAVARILIERRNE